MSRWLALVQGMDGVEVVGAADTCEAALELARGRGFCAWALRADQDVPDIKPRRPDSGRSWHRTSREAS